MSLWTIALVLCLVPVAFAAEGGSAKETRWIHPKCTLLPSDKTGPFVTLSDGRLIIVEGNGVLTSADDGRTWSEPRPLYSGPGPGIPHGGESGANRSPLIKIRNGAIILVYYDRGTRKWGWDKEKKEPAADCFCEMWAIRSLDEGKTWVDRQRIGDGGTSVSTIIQTQSGRVVVPVQPLLYDPGRWGQYTCVSDDDGKTWKRGNIIDLGGHGNHDGAVEGTLAERRDERVLMLLRTNLDQFWAAYSDDHGRYWRELRPSGIDASSAPGYLLRLASGRLVLACNRLNLQGQTGHATWGGDSNYSERPSSSQRQELSIAFSEDDGKTWSSPVVIARVSPAVCYPNIFERRPGELWITTGWRPRPALCFSLQERDFVGK
jgi:hypothetical protein